MPRGDARVSLRHRGAEGTLAARNWCPDRRSPDSGSPNPRPGPTPAPPAPPHASRTASGSSTGPSSSSPTPAPRSPNWSRSPPSREPATPRTAACARRSPRSSSPRHARLPCRTGLRQGRLARLRHAPAAPSGRPRSGGEPARRARPRLRQLPPDAGRGPHRDRRALPPAPRRAAWRRPCATPRRGNVFGAADRHQPAHPVHASPACRPACTPPASRGYDAARRLDRRQAVQDGGGDGQAHRAARPRWTTPAMRRRSSEGTAS